VSRAQQIEERAARWVLLREEPTWSPADEAELDAWLAESDAHKVAYWRLECGWREADRIASLGAPQDSPYQASRWHQRRSSWQPLAIAASLVLVFTAFLLQWPSFFPSQHMAQVQFETPLGGHKVVTLSDGTKVELNTDTVIKAAVNDRRRTVWLERGEAFFDVAKHKGRDFVIYAGARTITVLGTKFSVRRDPDEIVVAVLEGRVRVEDKASRGRDQEATITAGDVAIATDDSTLVRNSTEAVEQQLAWRSGRLLFEGETLAAAAEQFNRYNRKQLVFGDPEAARILVGGSFFARNVDQFARLLEDAYGLNVQDSPGRIILSTRRMASRGPIKEQLRPDLAIPRTRSVTEEAARRCGPGGGGACPVAVASAPQPQVQLARAPDIKAVRDARNWSVLHKLYPPRALAAREEGMVGFKVKIDASGSPTECKITHTSGHPLLDLETCQLIMLHATFKRPEGLSPSQERLYEGVVNWKLPTTPLESVPPAPKPIAEASAPEELVCKRIPKTGSIAAYERKCMTRSEWQRATSETTKSWDLPPGRAAACEGYPPRCR
jgi:transmembrane sensor